MVQTLLACRINHSCTRSQTPPRWRNKKPNDSVIRESHGNTQDLFKLPRQSEQALGNEENLSLTWDGWLQGFCCWVLVGLGCILLGSQTYRLGAPVFKPDKNERRGNPSTCQTMQPKCIYQSNATQIVSLHRQWQEFWGLGPSWLIRSHSPVTFQGFLGESDYSRPQRNLDLDNVQYLTTNLLLFFFWMFKNVLIIPQRNWPGLPSHD